MIALLTGIVKELYDQTIIITVQTIGYEVFVPNPSTFSLNETINLHTYLHWNQEQGPSFFGFRTKEEKKVFQLIIKCPGIGPKIGLAAIEHLGATQCIQGILAENTNLISSIPGIGKKKAEQIIVQLKHQAAKLVEKVHFDSSANLMELQKISDVLNSLNYSRTEINSTLEFLRKNNQEIMSFDLLLRKALSFLSKRA